MYLHITSLECRLLPKLLMLSDTSLLTGGAHLWRGLQQPGLRAAAAAGRRRLPGLGPDSRSRAEGRPQQQHPRRSEPTVCGVRACGLPEPEPEPEPGVL